MTERIADSVGCDGTPIPLGDAYPVLDDALITGEIPLLLTRLSLVPYEASTHARPGERSRD